MNRRRIALLTLIVVSILAARRGELLAATIAPDVRQTTNIAMAKPAIQKMLEATVAGLSDSNPANQRDAREKLVDEVMPGTPPVPPSTSFLIAYAQEVNDALLPLAKSKDVRVRVNVAVATARIAERANNSQLAPLVTQLLSDQSQAVVLWGLKAAKYVLPAALNNPSDAATALTDAFGEAAKKYVKDGPMTQSAYEALRNDQIMTAVTPPPGWSKVAPTIVQAMQKLLSLRLELYQQGVPEMPLDETIATSFLTSKLVWQNVPTALQVQTVQLSSDLLSAVSQDLQKAQTVERHDLIEVIKRVAQGLTVAGGYLNRSGDMEAVVKPLINVSVTTPDADTIGRVEKVYPALVKIPELSSLKPPPKIEQ